MTDKPVRTLFWRTRSGTDLRCCYRRVRINGTVSYWSLCGQSEIESAGDGKVRRPQEILRCRACDAEEMKFRDWDASGPTSTEFKRPTGERT